jgi:CubicO group peptidase (beta-lactamase class C family)
MKTTGKRSITYGSAWCALVMTALLLAASAAGQSTGAAAPGRAASAATVAPPSPLVGPADEVEVTAFLDGLIPGKLAELHIPGAVVVVVRDGRVLASRGFGVADLGSRSPVDPGRTVFRVGSVSKVVTAVAVMQLVERGAIRLDDDVNLHLRRFRLPETFAAPITVADLLRHTAGLDERHVGMHVRTPAEWVDLGDFLARRMPPRVLPPGEIIAYSDFGMSLAGFLVEEVEGRPFAASMQQLVLAPLGMRSSSFEQPPPPEIAARLATGYGYRGGRPKRYAYDLVEVSPAAALQSNGSDMAALMNALLDGGRVGEARILDPATVAAMLRRQVSHHPALRGRTFGFSEWLERGQRAVFHDGGMPGFTSRLFLLPEHRVGFFLATNGDQFSGAAGLNRELTTAFLERYFPEPPKPAEVTPQPGAEERAARLAGQYRSLHQLSRHTVEKITALEDEVPVENAGAGALRLPFGELVETAPSLYRWKDGASFVAFTPGDRGRPTRMFVGTGAYERLAWWESRPVQVGLLAVLALAFLASAVGAFLGAGSLGVGPPRATGTLLAAASLSNLGFVACFPVAFATVDRWELVYGLPPTMIALLLLPLAAVVLSALLLAATVAAWSHASGSLRARVWCSAFLVAEVAFVLWLRSWNLLGIVT